ncbi:MAG: peroxiredoxin-like family protein [Cyclobacteriaceae bacterium]
MSNKTYATHLKVGDQAPEIEGIESKGLTLNSLDMLELGKLVVIFYRGVWCPFCSEHLRNIEQSFLPIIAKGAHIMVITPQQPPFVTEMLKKSKGHFSIISDDEYKVMFDYGVAFEVTEENYKDFFASAKMEEEIKQSHNEEGKLILPIPATFIINEDNTIAYIHFDANFRKRLAAEDIMNHL